MADLVTKLRMAWTKGQRRLTPNEEAYLAMAQERLNSAPLTIEALAKWIKEEELRVLEEWATKEFKTEEERDYADVFYRAVVRNLKAIKKLIGFHDTTTLEKDLEKEVQKTQKHILT